MTIALQNQSGTYSRTYPLTKVYYWLGAPFKRLWWHIHAYSVIVGIMILTAFSMIALFVYDRSTKILPWLRQDWQSSHHAPEIPTSIRQQR